MPTVTTKPRAKRKAKGAPYVIVLKKDPHKMLADVHKLPTPPTTGDAKHAYVHRGRNSAFQFLKRNSRLRRQFIYRPLGQA